MLNENRYKNMTDNERILFNIAEDVVIYLQDDEDNVISPSLILWRLGFDSPTLKDKLVSTSVKVILDAKEPLALTAADFSKAFAKASDEFGNPKQDKQLIVELLTWIGLHLYPVAYPIAKQIDKE